jgi:hypothetical protein
MKRNLAFTFLFFIGLNSFATRKDSIIYYQLPDSIKATQFMTEINVKSFDARKYFNAGIMTDAVSISISSNGNRKKFYFGGSNYWEIKATGIGVKASPRDGFEFYYNWAVNLKYKLMIAVASDSAGNFSLYSGYIWFPEVSKWKFIGTVKITGRWTTIQQPALFYRPQKKGAVSINAIEVWCQRQNGSWKNMLQKDLAPPVVNLLSHVDSLEQLQIDKNLITQAIAENKTDAKQEHQGVYYTVLKEGNGRQVSVNDTVVAHYKGYLFMDNSVFDETKEKPATFPLKRLIMGWQIGVPLCKIGGKIKIIIPSNLAYSIRTRAAKIPPNSILVFEIEVVDARAPVN